VSDIIGTGLDFFVKKGVGAGTFFIASISFYIWILKACPKSFLRGEGGVCPCISPWMWCTKRKGNLFLIMTFARKKHFTKKTFSIHHCQSPDIKKYYILLKLNIKMFIVDNQIFVSIVHGLPVSITIPIPSRFEINRWPRGKYFEWLNEWMGKLQYIFNLYIFLFSLLLCI
jgi:hypothetical protein